MREIGSEFECGSIPVGLNKFTLDSFFEYKQYVLSGRTGLDLIAKHLLKGRRVKQIVLPDYCCYSMIEPFLRNRIKVNFYTMPLNCDFSEEGKIGEIELSIINADIVLVMDYFGFINESALKIVEIAKKLNKKIIVDATQTAFSLSKTYSYADYVIISYRKWFDLPCAIVYSKEDISVDCDKKHYQEYVSIYKKASKMKRIYLEDNGADKNEMLKTFASANSMLANDYENYFSSSDEIDRLNKIDSDFLISKRRENAQKLINCIRKTKIIDKIELIFDEINENDCPLFLPILITKKDRDDVKKSLIEKGIYCPAHWPIIEKNLQTTTKYHQKEISLICDQRYDCKDMEYQVNCLIEALSK